MAPRANWKGYLKLSLVSCPVALFPASSASEKVSFHMLNGATGNRLKQQYVDSETGDLVERDERIKGYEVAKGDYIHITDDELSDVQIESSHTIDIESFVPASEVDPIYIDNHYYLTPEGKVGEEAFAVIREAMRERKMVGIARVVLFGRERMVMVEPRSKGLMATTLHYAYEVRSDASYFDDIPKVELAKELLDLASHIIDTKKAKFDPSQFKDRYQDAVVALIKAKQSGKPVQVAKPSKPSNVVNLMDALRKSLGQGADTPAETKAPARKTATPARKAAAPTPRHKTAKPAAKPARRKAG
jgi:DNA end-binding protein Ku